MPPAPDIEADSGADRVIESRQLDEGIATTRFSSGGSRLTGRAPIPGAPAIVLLGDSYVVAREVSDASTMGAVLERLAMADGRPVNVRQYGWRAAGPEQYLTVASQVLRRWRPERVVIVLNDDDLDDRESALYAPGWAPPVTTWRDHSRVITLARHRTLLLDTRLKASLDRWRRRICCVIPAEASGLHVKNTVQVPRFARDGKSVVEAFKRAYGDRLALVYIANVGMRGGDSASTLESRLLAECARLDVPCASTRASMLALRRRHMIVRGFSTTTLGDGHLNPAGHEAVGHAIWGLVK